MCFLVTAVKQPGDTKVSKNNVSVRVNKHVLGLNISMYNIVRMNVLDSKELHHGLEETNYLLDKGTYKFCHIESYCFHVKFFLFKKVLQITSREVFLFQPL